MKSTNYENTFISVAEDCPVKVAVVPPLRGGKPTVASMQFEMLNGNPYKYTSDDVSFFVHAMKNGIERKDIAREWTEFFSKGQPCLRASPLTKLYGWGVHCDNEGRIAIFAVESKEYAKFAKDKALKQLKAMRSKRA
jgi:hypothetical protein